MARPKVCRVVRWKVSVTHLTPIGPGIVPINETILALEELEAIRLSDFLGIEQKKAAEQMGISQPTFHRLITIARKKVAGAIINNNVIKVCGGNYKIMKQWQDK